MVGAHSGEALDTVILELRMTLGKMESMLDIVTDPIVSTDARGTIRWCNAPFGELVGRPRLELLGSKFEAVALLRRHGRPFSPEGHPARDETREAKNILFDLARLDGEEKLLEISWATLQFPQGEPFVIFALHDITEFRKAADALTESKVAVAEAEAANKAKDNFLALVSHELRTPATSILGWAQMLARRDVDPEKTAAALFSIERNMNVLTQIVDDLLDVSSISAGKLALKSDWVDLSNVIEAAFGMVSFDAQAKGVEFDSSGVTQDIGVTGDAARLEQVAWNLLSNAVKFSPAGGKVIVRLERHGCFAKLSVADKGCGINPELLPFVFNRFWQAEHPMTRSHGGLGLGLSIVQHLVRLHGGSVEAASAGLGCGATFTVYIPMAKAPPDASARSEASTAAGGEHAKVLKGVKVLLIDDDADTREVLVAILNLFGAVAQAVGSAQAGLEILSNYAADVIICDLAMPREDGYDFIRKLRSRDASNGGAIPSLALSAYTREFDRTQALDAGFQAYLHKPVDAQKLAAAIRDIIRRQSCDGL